MDNNILSTLQNIRQQTSVLNRVAFVFHCWLPFNNLNSDGYRVPAIMSATIPRMTLIPILSTRVSLFDSVRNPATNKFMPVVQQHQRPIEASVSIITQRYGKFGFIRIPELDCDIEEAENYIRYFDAIMRPFKEQGGKMQDLPSYFGSTSPVDEIFDKKGDRVKTTAYAELDNLFSTGRIPETDYNIFRSALNRFAQSASTAHRVALMPGYGILQESITAVNEKYKSRFDEADEFLIREFPDFNSSSRITQRAQQDSTAALTEVFREFLAAQSQPKAPAPVEAPPVIPNVIERAPDISVVEEDSTVVNEEVAALNVDPVKCMATTKSNNACQLDARPGFKSCVNKAHQIQVGDLIVETANA